MSDFIRPYKRKGIANNGQVLIKDIDTTEGRIQGYFAVFGNKDSDGDVIMPGAFKKTLQQNYNRMKHLAQHNPLMPLSGTRSGNLTIKEDNHGLFFDSKITKTSWGKDTLLLYMDGVIDEHSIGYEVMQEQKASSYNELVQLKLWEGSSVTWGANEQALATGMKSMTKAQAVEKMDTLTKALRNGKYEQEEVFDMLEIYLKQLQTNILQLSEKSTFAAEEAPEPLESDYEDLTLLKMQFKKSLLKLKVA
jgi:hypothetical protein